MKKIYISLFFCILSAFALAQLTSTGKHITYQQITSNNDTVLVFIFNGISTTDTISYTGSSNNANWFEYSETISNTSNYFPNLTNFKDATGYILVVDGKQTAIWVIDYKNYFPAFNSIAAEFDPTNQCNDLNILLDIKPLTYRTPSGTPQNLPRDFKVSYQTREWTESWNTIDVDTTVTLTLPVSTISLPAPLCDTYYTISNDPIASELGLTDVPLKSQLYLAVAVKNNLTSVVTTRVEKNEAERPSVATQISGSAPMEVQFLSNANEPVAKFYNWTIYKNNQMIINRTDKDHRYTFSETGTFEVKLVTTNGVCTDSSSITITVSESKIEVPNVFTPNGDGYNDEFRVAFKSIVNSTVGFTIVGDDYCIIGQTLPKAGMNNKWKKANPGPYFYVIKAEGSDFDPNSEPDKKTKKRIGEYLLKGDINLLRGNK